MCNLLSITRGEYVLNGTKMVRTTSKLPIIINFHALVHVFLNTVSYYNWIIYNHRRAAEFAENLFLFCFPLTPEE